MKRQTKRRELQKLNQSYIVNVPTQDNPKARVHVKCLLLQKCKPQMCQNISDMYTNAHKYQSENNSSLVFIFQYFSSKILSSTLLIPFSDMISHTV